MVGKCRVMSIPEASLTKERVFNPYHVKDCSETLVAGGKWLGFRIFALTLQTTGSRHVWRLIRIKVLLLNPICPQG